MERKENPGKAPSHRGGSGNFAEDPKRAADAGHRVASTATAAANPKFRAAEAQSGPASLAGCGA